ncbi:MAG: fasciclin domain-containing protein [Pirellulales bacterium]
MVRRTFWMVAALAVAIGLGPEAKSQESNAKDIVTTAVEAGSFKTLAAALQAAGLVDALKSPGPFTVFAPTDEAFAKLPAGTVETLLKPENKRQLVAILTYHVVPGKVLAADVVKLKAAATVNGQRVDVKVDGNAVSIDDARVVKTDIACANGVIHVIDKVILPSSDSIPAVATKAGKFQTLLAAAKAAGLDEALSGDQPLTVFAPTDDAFAKLPAGTVESLLKPENKDQLAAILKYHVVAGRVFSSDLLGGVDAKTLQGGALSAKVVKGKATVNGAGLVMVDIDAANGVIHVIDSVLLPPAGGDKGAHAAPKACGGEAAACSTTTRVAMHRGFGRRR